MAAGILCFGVAGTTVLACGTNACTESLIAPSVVLGAAIVIFLAAALLPPGVTVLRWAEGAIAALTAVGSAFTAVLWISIFATEFLGDKTNPWHGSPLDGASQFLILVNNYGSRKIGWEGGSLVAFAEISMLALGFAVAAIALLASAWKLVQHQDRQKGLRRSLRHRLVLASGALVLILLLGYVSSAIPAIAAEAAGDRAASSVATAYRQLTSTYANAFANYNASPRSLADLQALGSVTAVAYAEFDRQLVSIRYPKSSQSDVSNAIQADASVVAASGRLATMSFGQNEQLLLTTFDDTRGSQRAAVEILIKDLAPPIQ